jgi:penicillin-binding protein 2
VRVPLDPQNWELITDAMSNVVAPIGTAPSAHLQGIDMAGKTGSAQTISNALKAKLGAGGKKFKDNGWFVGVEPRRDPEIVVCTLLEEGEHGYLAARTTAQVIKAYVEKQRRQPTKVAGSVDKNGKVEIGAVWTDSGGTNEDGTNEGENHLRAGRFLIDVARKRAPLAVAAPGLH